jgi:plastocyanin
MAHRQVIGWVVLVMAFAVATAGCGGGDGSSSNDAKSTTTSKTTTTTDKSGDYGTAGKSASETTLDLGVLPGKFQFDKAALTAKAGKVTLKLTNSESIQHNIAIKDSKGKELGAGDIVGDGDVSTVTVDLEPGTYEYFCTPHEALGMKGELTVS